MLADYLRTEAYRAISDRRPLEERWIKYQRSYRGVPEFPTKKFPWPGASNVVVTLMATDVDVIFSRLLGILFGPDNLWSSRARRPDMIEFAARLQELLQWAQDAELNAYQAVADFVLETVKLGTGILKTRYRREMRSVFQFRETPYGTMQQFVQRLVKDSPVLEHTSLYNFLSPLGGQNIQDLPWVGEKIRLTRQQYENRVRSGLYLNHPALQRHSVFADPASAYLAGLERLDLAKPSLSNALDLHEFWTNFDVRGVGEPVAVVCTLHLPTGALLRVDYNPFISQEYPYSVARFMRQEGRFHGIGICEMLEHYQDEVTAQHNQRIDAATISNAPVYKALIGSGLRADEPLYPGRILFLNNINDFDAVANQAQRYTTTSELENQTLGYAMQRTGVNDFVSGASSPEIGYAAAATNMLQSANATKRIDQSLREFRSAIAESGTRIAEMYQQFNQGGKLFEVFGEKDGAVLQQFLQFPLVQLRYAVGIDVTATTAALSKDMEIRTNTIVMGQITQFWQQLIQSLMLLSNPMVPPMIKNAVVLAIKSGTTMMRRLLDNYGLQDANELVPQLQEIIGGQQQQLDSLANPYGGGAVPAGFPLPAAGMGALPPGPGGPFAGAGGGGAFGGQPY